MNEMPIDTQSFFDQTSQHHPWKQARAAYKTVPDATAFRVAPLLLVMPTATGGADDSTRMVVGSVAVIVRTKKSLILRVFIAEMWTRLAGERHFEPVDDFAQSAVKIMVSEKLDKLVRGERPLIQGLSGQNLAAQCAKIISETSRESVQQLREFRYVVEQALAGASARSGMTAEHTRSVSSLIQLNVVCGRAGDQAREAIRESLGLWVDDDQAYHSYRKLRDPLILNRFSPATVRTRTWMRVHDASVRQCEELQRQLQVESEAILSLIQSGASISSAWDTEEQAKSNVLTAVISVGLGVPALVLTFYGASALLPLSGSRYVWAFAPVGIALIVGAGVALWKRRRTTKTGPWICFEALILLAILGLLIWAGFLAPSP